MYDLRLTKKKSYLLYLNKDMYRLYSVQRVNGHKHPLRHATWEPACVEWRSKLRQPWSVIACYNKSELGRLTTCYSLFIKAALSRVKTRALVLRIKY